MKVAYQLLQQTHRAPAYGLLLPQDTTQALHWAVHFQALEPRLYPTQLGWLLVTQKPIQQPPVGYIALQELHPHLFIPVDAQLIPGLLSDETTGLTRSQQVIVLPGPTFQTASLQPVPLRSLLVIPSLTESKWQSLPDAPQLADQLHMLEYTPSQQSLIDEANELLEPGGMGKDDPKVDGKLPRPPGNNPLKFLGGAAAYGVGKTLGGIGKMLGMKGLAGIGANLINKGVNLAPRLVENLLGKQEAALRALLRKFQMGDIEEALRRALPLGGDASRGAGIYNSDRLPVNQLSFNLLNLFSFSGVGTSIWLGGDDIMRRLTIEYRKQAELAEQRGDHRRAAYIYVKLLNDIHSAAAVLARGGLHRESALLYLRLNDELRAADQFEKAGLYDRAIELYRRNDRYDLSGILLTNLKLHEEALAEFTLGADKIVRTTGDYLRAGKLLEEYAHRTDLALNYYRQGWQARPLGSPVPCALRLALIYCQQRNTDEIQTLFDDGLQYFNNTTDDQLASTFINGILTETNNHRETVPAELRENLRDQALHHLGSRLRTGSMVRHSNNTLPRLLLPSRNWTASEFSDADFAFRTAHRKAPADVDPLRHVRKLILPAREPQPTCVAMAEQGKWLFVGFASGEVFRVNLTNGEIITVSASLREQPIALAVSPTGTHLHELRKPSTSDDKYRLLLHASSGQSSHFVEEIILQSDDVWLSPYLLQEYDGRRTIVYADGEDLLVRRYPNGEVLKYPRTLTHGDLLRLALPSSSTSVGDIHLIGFDGFRLYDLVAGKSNLKVHRSNTIGWSSRFTGQDHAIQPLHYLRLPEKLLLTGIGSNGMVYVTQHGECGVLYTYVSTGDEQYFAACFVDHETVVATARNALHWYHVQRDGLRLTRVQEIALGPTEACYATPHDRSMVVLKQNALLILPRA